MKLSKIIKRDSKTLLSRNYGKGIAIILLLWAINAVINFVDALAFNICGYDLVEISHNIFSYSENIVFSPVPFVISFIGMIIKLVLIVPIVVGMVNIYLNMIDKKEVAVGDVFLPYETKMFGRSIGLTINLTIKRFFITLVFNAIPLGIIGAAVFIILDSSSYMFAPILAIAGGVMLIISLIFTEIFMQRYSLAKLLICQKYSYSVHKAVKTSVKYMKSHKGQLFSFKLSYLPYYIPMILSLIGYVAVDSMHLFTAPIKAVVIVVSTLTILLVSPYYLMGTTMYERYLFELGEHIFNPKSNVASEEVNSTPIQNTFVNTEVRQEEVLGQDIPRQEEPKVEEPKQEVPTVIEAMPVSEPVVTETVEEPVAQETESTVTSENIEQVATTPVENEENKE